MHILSLAHIVLAANGDPKANSFYKRTSFRLLDEDSATQLTQLKGNAEAPEFGCRVFLFREVKQRCRNGSAGREDFQDMKPGYYLVITGRKKKRKNAWSGHRVAPEWFGPRLNYILEDEQLWNPSTEYSAAKHIWCYVDLDGMPTSTPTRIADFKERLAATLLQPNVRYPFGKLACPQADPQALLKHAADKRNSALAPSSSRPAVSMPAEALPPASPEIRFGNLGSSDGNDPVPTTDETASNTTPLIGSASGSNSISPKDVALTTANAIDCSPAAETSSADERSPLSFPRPWQQEHLQQLVQRMEQIRGAKVDRDRYVKILCEWGYDFPAAFSGESPGDIPLGHWRVLCQVAHKVQTPTTVADGTLPTLAHKVQTPTTVANGTLPTLAQKAKPPRPTYEQMLKEIEKLKKQAEHYQQAVFIYMNAPDNPAQHAQPQVIAIGPPEVQEKATATQVRRVAELTGQPWTKVYEAHFADERGMRLRYTSRLLYEDWEMGLIFWKPAEGQQIDECEQQQKSEYDLAKDPHANSFRCCAHGR